MVGSNHASQPAKAEGREQVEDGHGSQDQTHAQDKPRQKPDEDRQIVPSGCLAVSPEVVADPVPHDSPLGGSRDLLHTPFWRSIPGALFHEALQPRSQIHDAIGAWKRLSFGPCYGNSGLV